MLFLKQFYGHCQQMFYYLPGLRLANYTELSTATKRFWASQFGKFVSQFWRFVMSSSDDIQNKLVTRHSLYQGQCGEPLLQRPRDLDHKGKHEQCKLTCCFVYMSIHMHYRSMIPIFKFGFSNHMAGNNKLFA